jgi:hypothetical protein
MKRRVSLIVLFAVLAVSAALIVGLRPAKRLRGNADAPCVEFRGAARASS